MLLKSVKFSSYKDLVRSLIEGKIFYFYRNSLPLKITMNPLDEIYRGTSVISVCFWFK